MIFVDSNVPMYMAGSPHPNRDRAAELLAELVRSEERLVTDSEVYQEILHRYAAIRRFETIDIAFRALDEIIDDVLTFGRREIQTARTIIDTVPSLSARDAVHVAVMRHAGISRIFSFDRGFDACPGLERLS